jgi:hypothetical protein
MLTFAQCLHAALSNEEFIQQYDRLSGGHLNKLLKRKPIDIMVDKATGYEVILENEVRESARQFIKFVYDVIYSRLQD